MNDWSRLERKITPKPLKTIVQGVSEDSLYWATMMPRDTSVLESYTSDRYGFSSLGWCLRQNNFTTITKHCVHLFILLKKGLSTQGGDPPLPLCTFIALLH